MVKDAGLKGMMEQMFGMPEEDQARVTAGLEQGLLNALPKVGSYRLVAEVVSSKYCFQGLQVGQKYVVENGALLNQEESDAPVCLGAVLELVEKAHVMMDRVFTNGDITAPISGYKCTDPGLDLGGLGCVEFKVTVEEK